MNAVTKENFPNPSDVRATENGNHIINELADVYEELGPEKLSCAEFDILIGLAITFYRQNERKP